MKPRWVIAAAATSSFSRSFLLAALLALAGLVPIALAREVRL